MEKFAIDLDKVLDDFERSEDSDLPKKTLDHHGYSNQMSRFYHPTSHNSSSNQETNKSFSYLRQENSTNSPYENSEKIDLSGADFSASTSSLSSTHTAFSQLTQALDSIKLYDTHEQISPITISDLPAARLNTMVQLSTTYNRPIVSNGLDQIVEDVLAVHVTPNNDFPNSSDFEIKLLPSQTNDDLPYTTKYLVHFPSFNSSENSNCERSDVVITEVDDQVLSDDQAKDIDERENSTDKPWENLMAELELVDNVLVSSQQIDVEAVGFAVGEVTDLSTADLEGYLQDLEDIDFQNLVAENNLTIGEDGADSSLTVDSMTALLDPNVPIDCSPSQSDSETTTDGPELEELIAKPSINIGGARPKVRDISPAFKQSSQPNETKILTSIPCDETPNQSANDMPPSYSYQDLHVSEPFGTLPESSDTVSKDNDVSTQSDSLTDISQLPQEDTDNGRAKISRPTSLNLPAPLLVDQDPVIAEAVPLEMVEGVALTASTPSPALSETDSALPPSPEAGGSSQEEQLIIQDEVKLKADDESDDVIVDESSPDFLPEDNSEELKNEETQISNLSLESLTEEEQLLGKIRPFWIPDEEAPNCLHCNIKFTVLKRRHHCRGCGKVLCSQCCSCRAPIAYLEDKIARVCQPCFETLNKVAVAVHIYEAGQTTEEFKPVTKEVEHGEEVEDSGGGNLKVTSGENKRGPNPNNPQEYCSQVSPLQQAETYSARPPPVVMVPVGVLKRGDKPKGEPKQVMFSDGIRPGGDLTELDLALSPEPKLLGRKSTERMGRRVLDKSSPDYSVDDKPDASQLLKCLKDESARPVVFALTKNLFVYIKLVKLDCCLHKECWVFASKGLNCVGQDEVMVLLERLPDENLLPRDLFLLFTALYDNASMGSPVGELGHLLFPEGLLGSREHGAFLFLRPTYQCLSKLHLPRAPYLVAILLQKWEVPWAKVFPLRLMLRIGAEYKYYPSPLVSIRFRKPVYAEIGHTIMSVLADFRNYQYTLATIPGVMVCMEDKKTTVCFPRNRYSQVLRVVSNSNEHVLGLGATFSLEADSHLVCIQDDEGNYQTQAINIQNTPRKVTGASFIVFSGALKTSTGLTAKSSIVEDGLLVQITSEAMVSLKSSFQDMKDFVINCGQLDAPTPEEQVILKWIHDDRNFNIGVRSPIDGQCLDGVESMRIHSGTDYSADQYLIRWTEVFFFLNDSCKRGEALDGSKLADTVAQACCLALVSHLSHLSQADLTKIGLRVTLDSDKVGYEVGAKEEPLPSVYMIDLDTALIPVITSASSTNAADGGSLTLELIFHILNK